MTRWKESDLLKLKDKIRQEKHHFIIGIDVGTQTGLAMWDRKEKQFVLLETLKIHQAMERVKVWYCARNVFIRVEDARQVRYKTDPVKAQGAGSVKRDSQIWFDFLTDLGVAFEMVRPNNKITKWTSEEFNARTGFSGKSSKHSRDAAMLVYNF